MLLLVLLLLLLLQVVEIHLRSLLLVITDVSVAVVIAKVLDLLVHFIFFARIERLRDGLVVNEVAVPFQFVRLKKEKDKEEVEK